MSRLLRVVIVLMLFAALPSHPLFASASERDRPTPQQTADRLRQESNGQIEFAWDEVTGVPRFIYGAFPIDRAGRSAEDTARSFFSRYGDLFRISDPARELSLKRIDQDELGISHVRFQQRVNDVPVFGGDLIVHVKADRITAINGIFFPSVKIDTAPTVSQAVADKIARASIGDPDAELRADHSGLTVYVDNGQPHLTWKFNLYSEKNLGNWLLFVDAHDGSIVHQLNQLDTAKSIKVYNMNHSAVPPSTLPGTLVCGTGVGGDPTCDVTSDLDARGAYTNTSKVYDYYKNTFGRLSYDNLDTELKSSIHYGTNYPNAFWNGSQMVYGDADTFAQAFDVIAHELTHGVTQETDALIYEHQSGALNESWSDVMAVFAGCSAQTGTANCNWLMGDTLTGGAVRDLSNPAAFGDPDHFSNYLWLPLEADNGGVHTNSGIPNKAAYLLTAGGTFHSVTVTGIDYTKAEQIYYGAMTHYMTTYSNFFDTRSALYSACRDEIGTFGITQLNCDQVYNAWASVGIGNPAPTTPPGSNKIYLPLTLNNYPLISCSASQILSNGSFEAGAASWVQSDPEIISQQFPLDGAWSAWLGGYDSANDTLHQAIGIPANRTAMQVSFYVHVFTTDSLSVAKDKLYASIQPAGSVTLPEILTVDNRDAVNGWWHVTLTYNELPYAGQSMRLYLHATTDNASFTNFFVDTASVQVQCTRYPSAASANGAPTVTLERMTDQPAPDRSATMPRR